VNDFLDAWLRGVVPLRRRLSGSPSWAWVVEDDDELVWILGYDGPDGLTRADDR
jgi:hypothetical protein